MKSLRVIAPIVFFGAVACGTEQTDLDVTLEAPQPAEARVSISAALEVSELLDNLADRVVIEDITVNLAEVRLLAADPRIPPGGYSLLSQATLLEFYGAEDSKLELPFPEQFLAQEDLAVYLRIAPSIELDTASIVVNGRYYANPIAGGHSKLKSSESTTESTDPDGDPVRPRANNEDERITQQSDSPMGGDDCSTDPDGDPVDCGRKMLVGRGMADGESVAFELRTSDIADLVATFGNDAALDVVVGIPASQWFTEDMVQTLEKALLAQQGEISPEDRKGSSIDDVIVVDSAERATQDRMRDRRDYFVTNRDVDELTVRR